MYLRETLESVLSQTVLPTQWIIVDDGSTDGTSDMLKEYAARHAWIRIVTRVDRGYRAVGPGVIDAFYAGLKTIDPADYEFLCKLDLDLRLPNRYFEILIERMGADRQIATCSGKAYLELDGRLVSEQHGDDTSLGMTKFYRTACFLAIGGFVREVMWDGIDCHLCRMRGWRACSWDDVELRFVHLRTMGSSQRGVHTGRSRHGYGQYFMGTGPLYMAVSALSRVTQRPYVTGSMAMLWGWISSAVRRLPRYDNPEFRRFLRHYQWRVLCVGKRRALEECVDRPRASLG
jgi:glycosyltransferase involved in cell wall biosynthesis